MTLKEHFKQRLMNALAEQVTIPSSEDELHRIREIQRRPDQIAAREARREEERMRTPWPPTDDYGSRKPFPPGSWTTVTEIEPRAHVPDETKAGFVNPPGFVKGSQGRTLRERGVKIAEPESNLSAADLITAPFEYYGRKLGNTLQRAIGRPETYHKHVPSSSDIKPQD